MTDLILNLESEEFLRVFFFFFLSLVYFCFIVFLLRFVLHRSIGTIVGAMEVNP